MFTPSSAAAYTLPTAYYPTLVGSYVPASAFDPVAAYAAAYPTMWTGTPSPHTQDAGIGSTLLDALASLTRPLDGITAAVDPTMPVAAVGAGSAASADAATDPAVATVAALPARSAPVAAAPVVAPHASSRTVALAYATTASAKARSVVRKAKKQGAELWAGIKNPRLVHITQVPSKYNPAPGANNRDCGPASVVMALRLLGKRIPGLAAHATPQGAIHRVRQLAGQVQETVATTNFDLERALARAGTATAEIASGAAVKAAVLAGHPVILNGNPRNPGSYGWRFPAAKMVPYDGAHWIVVSGYDTKTHKYIINDPLSMAGPVKVSAAQLEAYRGGSMGIEVTSTAA